MKTCTSWLLGAVMVLAAGGLLAQGTAVLPAFEVASIKPAAPLSPEKIRAGQIHVGISAKGSRADFGFVSRADLLPFCLSGQAASDLRAGVDARSALGYCGETTGGYIAGAGPGNGAESAVSLLFTSGGFGVQALEMAGDGPPFYGRVGGVDAGP